MKTSAKQYVIAAMISLSCITTSYGADFTLVVPVNISNLPPEIDTIRVCCQVSDSATGGGRLIGAGGTCQTAPVTGGAFRGELTVSYNAAPGVDPATARGYNCKAGFLGTVSGVRTTFDAMLLGSRDIPLSSGSLRTSGAISP